MALTDKFNFYLNIYKSLNPGVGVSVNSLDGFLNFIKKKYPSFYNQAQAQVREIMRQAQPQSGGNGQKPPTNPPTKNGGGTPEPPDKNPKQTSGKPGAYKATDPKQVAQAKTAKRIDKLYQNPTSPQNLKDQFKTVTNGAGKTFTPKNPIPTNPTEVAKSVTNFVDEGKGLLGKVTGGMTKLGIPGAGALTSIGGTVLNSALAVPAGINAVQNWNAPGSDWETRLLDVSAPVAIAGAPFLASRIPSLGKGTEFIKGAVNTAKNVGVDTLGFITGAQGMSEAKQMRANNVAGNKTPISDYLADTQYDLSKVPDDVRARYNQEMQYKATHGGQGTPPLKTPNFMEGVEGSDLNVELETPEQIRKKFGLDINQLDDNPPITTLPTLPGTSASSRQEPPRQVITGDGSVVASRANNGDNYTPTNENSTINFNNDNNENNFINNVINRANNMTVDEARAGLQAQGAQPAQTSIDEQAYINQLLDKSGTISPVEMRDLITDKYSSLRDINRQNPLYGGEYIQPGGYSIDPTLARLQAERDALDASTGVQSRNFLSGYLNPLRAEYNARIANQAGVPYEDYVDGMKERAKNDLILGQKEVEQQLTNIASQSNDMKTRLEAANRIILGRQQLEQKLAEIETQAKYTKEIEEMKQRYGLLDRQMQNQGNFDVEVQKGRNAIDLEKLRQGDPNEQMKALGYYAQTTGFGYSGDRTAMANALALLNPELQKRYYGRTLTVAEAMQILNAANPQSNLSPNGFQQWLINNTQFMR